MQLNVTTDEAQALLDGINVVLKEKARDLGFFSEVTPPGPSRDKVLAKLRAELDIAKSARRKLMGG